MLDRLGLDRPPVPPVATTRTRSRRVERLALIAGASVLAVLGASCGDDGGASPVAATAVAGPTTTAAFAGCEVVGGSSSGAVATVAVQLADYAVVPGTTRVAPGLVRFDAQNIGRRPHELVVVRAASVAKLPKEKDGSMAEERLADNALAGEIEEFPTGERCAGTFELESGTYVLLCNLVEADTSGPIVHLNKGMATTIEVR